VVFLIEGRIFIATSGIWSSRWSGILTSKFLKMQTWSTHIREPSIEKRTEIFHCTSPCERFKGGYFLFETFLIKFKNQPYGQFY
jgi:hypothetical protein